MPKPLNVNLSDENYRVAIPSFVPSLGGKPHQHKTLQQLREIYAELQNELEDKDLSEQKKQDLHSVSYRCAIAILTWGQIDIVEDIFTHLNMLSHDTLIAGINRIATRAFNNIIFLLLLAVSNKVGISPEEWYLQNKDKLEWDETLQRVVLKKSDTTQNSET